MMREFVGRGKQKPFEVPGIWREIGNQRAVLRRVQETFPVTDAGAVHFGRDVEHRPAFWNGDVMNKNSSLRDLPKNLAGRYRMVEIVFTGLQRSSYVPQA